MNFPADNPAGFEFLLIEIETGLTFANLALTTPPEEHDKIIRNRQNARAAYDSILRFQGNVAMTEQMKVQFNGGFQKLLDALRCLGETV